MNSVTHGVNCPKTPHVMTGYLHGPEDDTPYDVDGVTYCGRCHQYIDTAMDIARRQERELKSSRRANRRAAR